MRSPIQATLLVSLAAILRPLVKLLLRAGMGSSEFIAVAKSVFVHVASEEFGLRGRPTNISRVSAMTGISRKEIRLIREEGPISRRWTPVLESNPASQVLHHWHYDAAFSSTPGEPKPLPFEGPDSFSTLVAKYAGDIPPGAVRTELRRAGTIEDSDGLLVVKQRYFVSAAFDEDLINRITFALTNLGSTVVHNAELYHARGTNAPATAGRLERSAWTERLSEADQAQFRAWVRQQGAKFVEDANQWLGERELPKAAWQAHTPRTVGVGVYYFEEDL